MTMTDEEYERVAKRLAERFGQEINAARDILGKFARDVGGPKPWDAAYAMEWGHVEFKAAARLKVFSTVVDAMRLHREPDVGSGVMSYRNSLDHIRRYALREMMQKARSGENSSSPTANLIEREELAAWSVVFDDFDGAMEHPWHVDPS